MHGSSPRMFHWSDSGTQQVLGFEFICTRESNDECYVDVTTDGVEIVNIAMSASTQDAERVVDAWLQARIAEVLPADFTVSTVREGRPPSTMRSRSSGISTMLSYFSRAARDNRIMRAAIATFGRGIHKRIDENRELLEYLENHAPNLMKEHPWIRGWIEGNDEFFVQIEKVAGVQNPIQGVHPHRAYPRPWPVGPGETQPD